MLVPVSAGGGGITVTSETATVCWHTSWAAMLTVTLMLRVMDAVLLVQWLKVPGSGDSSPCGLFREVCPRINAITFSLKSRQPILTIATTSCDRSKASHVHFGVTGTDQGTGPMIVVCQCQDPAAPLFPWHGGDIHARVQHVCHYGLQVRCLHPAGTAAVIVLGQLCKGDEQLSTLPAFRRHTLQREMSRNRIKSPCFFGHKETKSTTRSRCEPEHCPLLSVLTRPLVLHGLSPEISWFLNIYFFIIF